MNTEKRELGRIYTAEEIKIQAELDAKNLENCWKKVEEKLCKMAEPKLAYEIISALKEMYSIYKKEAVDWCANLYDPKIGGFYYSNSARDNEEVECEGKIYKLLPDLESTIQAFGFISNSHMADLFDKKAAYALPAWMGEQIVSFVKKMQDEKNGYFYHPQWGHERTDKWQNRRGRDLTWAERLLEYYGETPLYKTPHQDRSEDKKQEKAETSPHLKDKESFTDYLNSLGYEEKNAYSAYVVGNKLEAQILEIKTRDLELEKEGADFRLLEILKEWLDERFNFQNGTWTKDAFSHDSANGILKVASTYIKAGLPLPDPITSVKAAIRCVTIDKAPEHICCILNPWYALNIIISAVKSNPAYEDKEQMLKILDEMHNEIMKNLPKMIRHTTKNLKTFQKEDGSFSYLPNRSSHYSQMMPVAIPNTNEGDLNASMICTVSVPTHIFNYLGFNSIPIYTESDRMRMVNILQSKYEKMKKEEANE